MTSVLGGAPVTAQPGELVFRVSETDIRVELHKDSDMDMLRHRVELLSLMLRDFPFDAYAAQLKGGRA